MVPEVRVRGEPLVAEGRGTHAGVRAVLPWLFQHDQSLGADGLQCAQDLYPGVVRGQALRAVRPRFTWFIYD